MAPASDEAHFVAVDLTRKGTSGRDEARGVLRPAAGRLRLLWGPIDMRRAYERARQLSVKVTLT